MQLFVYLLVTIYIASILLNLSYFFMKKLFFTFFNFDFFIYFFCQKSQKSKKSNIIWFIKKHPIKNKFFFFNY